MTSQEMQYNFELKINTLRKFDKPFSSEDIAILLKKAQLELIDERYSPLIGPQGISFESNEKVRGELGKLISNHKVNTGSFVTSGTELHPNALFALLPGNYLYSIQESCVVSYRDCNADIVTSIARVLPITHDEYMMNIENPFGEPYEKLVWRMDFAGPTGTKKHELIHASGHTITSYNLRYLRRPLDIDIINGVDCELIPELHEEIVDRAVKMALVIFSLETKK